MSNIAEAVERVKSMVGSKSAETTKLAGKLRFAETTVCGVTVYNVNPRCMFTRSGIRLLFKCRIYISSVEVKQIIRGVYPLLDTSEMKCNDFTTEEVIGGHSVIKVPCVVDGEFTSMDEPISDIPDVYSVILRGTFDADVIVAIECRKGVDVILSGSISRVTRTREPMRYMGDEVFPDWLVDGLDISVEDLDLFMNTY